MKLIDIGFGSMAAAARVVAVVGPDSAPVKRLGQAGIEEQRLLTEAAIFADKTAVDEETVRLSSHIAQFREILEREEPVGRNLDFLLQEFNREANTIGSKVQDVQAARIVVEIKSAIERIREQVQNVE